MAVTAHSPPADDKVSVIVSTESDVAGQETFIEA